MHKAVIGAMVLTVAWQAGCARKQQQGTKSRAVPARCRKLVARHERCLDALAVVARDRGTDLLLRSMADLPADQREALRKQVTAALERNEGDLRKLLAKSVKEEFASWCAAEATSKKGKALVGKLHACLAQPDCQTYSACIGRVLEELEPASPTPGARPARDTVPASRGTGDATGRPGAATPRPGAASQQHHASGTRPVDSQQGKPGKGGAAAVGHAADKPSKPAGKTVRSKGSK